ncbi:hypothetical protein [Alloscardovia criceti]|uniref:hypothetical protein n=1 Tax=Alloscardovia criceti TaxID=356828 RepID=UPI001B7FAE24|nr:hypothetical protein [Alloscardovia criceti]
MWAYAFCFYFFFPNILWLKFQPSNYSAKNENRVLLTLERLGQVMVTVSVLIFDNFNLKVWSAWSWWLVAAAVCMLLYELWWIRYFRSEKTLADFYSGFLGIPLRWQRYL